MGQHRTPEQMLAEAIAKVEALQIKVVQRKVSDNPRMISLTKAEKEIRKELGKAMKYLDPEKGLVVRIGKLQAQIVDAEERLANADDIQKTLKAQLDGCIEAQKELATELHQEESV